MIKFENKLVFAILKLNFRRRVSFAGTNSVGVQSEGEAEGGRSGSDKPSGSKRGGEFRRARAEAKPRRPARNGFAQSLEYPTALLLKEYLRLYKTRIKY
ncbi:MAG: hypothetical protein AUJ39_01240 [Parcubacteria group bacterium CG1_02_42_13]|nr:MAG: hypothetical protein AUJ39_01240 [Parcubacteria group bacterium CG1_02_42_13]